jgi:hypothetical protein
MLTIIYFLSMKPPYNIGFEILLKVVDAELPCRELSFSIFKSHTTKNK